MANKEAIMDKIVRNMKQRGFSGATRTATGLQLQKSSGAADATKILQVVYVDKSGNAPQIGVSDAVSPFLGIGVAAPGSIKIIGGTADTTLALTMDSIEALVLLSAISGMANDIVLEEGATNTEVGRIAGHSDVLGLGE